MVLPDCDNSSAAADLFQCDGRQLVSHSSGRPWLIGRWPTEELQLATVGTTRLAVLGRCPVSSTELTDLAAGVRDAADLNRIAVRLPGSFHLLASVDGRVRAQGTVSGLRRLFRGRLANVSVVADRSDVLAPFVGDTNKPSMREEQLAIRLLGFSIPHPLQNESVWPGVQCVPPGSATLLEPDGAASEVRWWRPPEPDVGLVEGATALRDALSSAVNARVRSGDTVSADLSGGLDSTPLNFLAARDADHLIAVTMTGQDPLHDDAKWARQAAVHLPNTTHLLLGTDQLPANFADLADAGKGLDEPDNPSRVSSRYLHIARLVAQHGARVHLSGEGGDEVLQPAPPYLHDIFWSRPWSALPYVRARRAANRWSLPATVRALVERPPYDAWLARSAGDLQAGLAFDRRPQLGWGWRPELPPWASADAVDMVRTSLRAAARDAEPLSSSRAQHHTLLGLQYGSRVMRSLAWRVAESGCSMEFPFCDDRVIEACLAVRPQERATRTTFKPLIVEAMRGIVPAELLNRSTKGEFSAEFWAGLRGGRTRGARKSDPAPRPVRHPGQLGCHGLGGHLEQHHRDRRGCVRSGSPFR